MTTRDKTDAQLTKEQMNPNDQTNVSTDVSLVPHWTYPNNPTDVAQA